MIDILPLKVQFLTGILGMKTSLDNVTGNLPLFSGVSPFGERKI
jgi:hypothetical protein